MDFLKLENCSIASDSVASASILSSNRSNQEDLDRIVEIEPRKSSYDLNLESQLQHYPHSSLALVNFGRNKNADLHSV